MADLVDQRPLKAKIDLSALMPPTPPAPQALSGSLTKFAGIRLRIHKVVMVDETSGALGKEADEDDIFLVGVALDASLGKTLNTPGTTGL